MSDSNITYLTDVFLLTCVVQTGLSEVILKAARDVGANAGAISHRARGTGVRERLGLLGIAVEAEKEVISILVSSEQRDLVYDNLYRAADMDVPGRGFILVMPLEKVSTYIPKSMIEDLDNSGEDASTANRLATHRYRVKPVNSSAVYCLPDDGTEKKLIRALRDEKQIMRANSISCLGMAVLAEIKTKFGELPKPVLVKKVDVVVPEADADELYDYIYEKANIGRPEGGVIWLAALTVASSFALPADVPVEKA